MKKILSLTIILIASNWGIWSQNALEIVNKADEAFTAERVYSRSTMTVYKSGEAQPTQELESFSMEKNGKSYSLSIYLAPRRMKGTANLMVDNNLWVRFSSTGRIRKMSSSAKKNSAGGTDFSYADMGEGDQGLAAKYTPILLGEETIANEFCYKIELLSNQSGSAYEKLHVLIAKENFAYVRIDYFESDANIKSIFFSDYRIIEGKHFPFAYTMKNHTKPSETRVLVQVFEINSPKIQDRFFTTGYLESIR